MNFPRVRTGLQGLALIGAALALSGCVTTASGPPCSYDFREQDNFFTATGSVASGEYQRCTEHLMAQLEDIQIKANRAQKNAERLEQLADQTSGEAKAAATRLARVNRESQAAARDLQELRRKKEFDQRELNQLVERQAELERRKAELSQQAASGEDAARLRAEIEFLNQEQDRLRQVIQDQLRT